MNIDKISVGRCGRIKTRDEIRPLEVFPITLCLETFYEAAICGTYRIYFITIVEAAVRRIFFLPVLEAVVFPEDC
jgi:hypothetical protein